MGAPKPIQTEAEYSAALARIWQLWDAPEGDPTHDELDALVDLVERYKDKHEPMGYPTPIGAIEFLIDQEGRTPEYLGTTSEVTEVLAGARPLTPRMAHVLHERFGIPYDSLLRQEPAQAGVTTGRSAEEPGRSQRDES